MAQQLLGYKEEFLMTDDIKYIKIDPNGSKDPIVIEMKVKLEHIEDNYVNKYEFAPVRLIAYGLAGTALLAVLGAVLKLVVGA